MSEAPSIQIRRVTNKIENYFQRFGLRTSSNIQSSRAYISGVKSMGPNEIQCRVAETSRGTAISFYQINNWRLSLVFIPFMLTALLLTINSFGLTQLISGGGIFGINLLKLFLGNFTIGVEGIVILVFIPTLFAVGTFLVNRIRLGNLKQRFALFSKDAIWEPRDTPIPLLQLKVSQTGFFHIWILAMLFFFVNSLPSKVISEVVSVYGIKEADFLLALQIGFGAISGTILGLIVGYKAIKLRAEYAKNIPSYRVSGTYLERKYEPMFFAVQSAFLASLPVILFLSVTFLAGSTIQSILFFYSGLFVGGLLAGFIHEESLLWFIGAYIGTLFFTSLIFVFRTGQDGGFAFVLIQILFLIPMALFVVAPLQFNYVLKKYKIDTQDHLFNALPVPQFYTYYMMRKLEKKKEIQYEQILQAEIPQEDNVVYLDKKSLVNKAGEISLLIARHYFELISRYNSMFDEKEVVIVPNFDTLLQWWSQKSEKPLSDDNKSFIQISDKLIWDPDFNSKETDLQRIEIIGKSMVLTVS